MVKQIITLICGTVVIGLVAFKAANHDADHATATVDKIQGVYIFAKCKPVKEYEYLGTIKGPLVGNHEFDNLVELMVRNAKKEFPSANALIFDGAIKQTHNTKVSAVRLRD